MTGPVAIAFFHLVGSYSRSPTDVDGAVYSAIFCLFVDHPHVFEEVEFAIAYEVVPEEIRFEFRYGLRDELVAARASPEVPYRRLLRRA